MKQEFYIDSDGIRLHAKLDRVEGKDKSPLCILIHGFTGHMEEDHCYTRHLNEVADAIQSFFEAKI